MSLLSIILHLAVIGLVWHLIVTYIPMHPVMKNVITAIAVIVVVLFLLSVFGIGDFYIGKPVRIL